MLNTVGNGCLVIISKSQQAGCFNINGFSLVLKNKARFDRQNALTPRKKQWVNALHC